MDKTSNKLEYRHIREPVTEILRYINDRRHGVSKSLKTKWKKFNTACMGGIEPNTIYTIAGISSSGKSAFANSLEVDLFDLNPNEKFVILSFSFEMLASKQVGRKLSYKMKRTTSDLYSSNYQYGSKISNEEYDEIKKFADKIEKYPIYYIDRPGTVNEIRNTILDFQAKLRNRGIWLIVILDHVLLTKGRSGDREREILFELQRMFMEIKKIGMTTIIQLSQLNRNIESSDRIINNFMHYPQRSDIFGSDTLFQSSDYMIVLHRPEMLGISSYGVNELPVKDMIYLHLLKNREGEPKILAFFNNLKYNSIEEVSLSNIKTE